VITRYLFPQPAAWTYEIAVITFAWCVFFGAAAGIRLRLHADIDLLVKLFPERWQRVVDVMNWLLLVILFAVLAVLFVVQSFASVHIYTIALSLPRTVLYAPLALACLLMLFHHLRLWGSWNQPGLVTQARDVV
jgi:TRAP-type C4-dicarboxylate transport system permease small subunit